MFHGIILAFGLLDEGSLTTMEEAGPRMKAAYAKYGPPDVVEVKDLDKPVPKENEVLIKVRAASVNPLDWKTTTGGPYIVRLLLGLRNPKIKQLSVDVAGVIEAVGGNVTQFKPGDAVFGACLWGICRVCVYGPIGESNEIGFGHETGKRDV